MPKALLLRIKKLGRITLNCAGHNMFSQKNPGKRKTITNIKVSKKTSRDALRDGCIKEFIKQKRSSGLFWAVRAAEKRKPPNCYK